MIIVDEHRGRCVPLDPTGALLWKCLDGISPLDEICTDFSAELGVDHDLVATRVDVLARTLLDSGVATAPGYDARFPSVDATVECGCGAAHGDLAVRLDGTQPELAHDAVTLPEPSSPCREQHFPLGSEGEIMARLVAADGAEQLLGIRTNDASAADAIRRRLGPLLAEAPFGFPNIEVRFGSRRGAMTDVNLVYRRAIEVLRTFSREQAIDGALAQLHTFRAPPAGTTPMRVLALQRAGSVVLVSDTFSPAVDAQHRRLAAAGYSRWLHTPVLVDAAEHEALLPRECDASEPEFTRMPISHLVSPGVALPPDLPIPDLVTRNKILIAGPLRPLRAENLGALARLASSVPIVRIDSWDSRQVAQALVEL